MLIEGWRHSPGEAALTVTVMPIAALVAGRWARARGGLVPALAGCVLVAGGLAALGLLPSAEAAWTLVPQLAIGLGLGLALATLIGATVGERGPEEGAPAAAAVARPAAWTIGARHMGIVVGLLLLTPIFTADLDRIRPPGERAGLARVLDAPLPLAPKIDLARELDRQIQAAGDQELPDLDEAFADLDLPASEARAVAELRAGLDEELDRAATEAFSRSFLAAALIALLAAGAVAVAARRDPGRPRGEPGSNGSPLRSGAPLAVAVPAAATAAALLLGAYVLLGGGGYEPSKVADPCVERARPDVDRTQLVALAALGRDGLRPRPHARGPRAVAARRQGARGRLRRRVHRRFGGGDRPRGAGGRAELARRDGAEARREDRRGAGDHRVAPGQRVGLKLHL